ncbi:MAG: glycosyltransferase [Candidatus Competibacteraceae bacterium]|nr:glycosyltransferase [Candidatus Competibacteraceae bacterium]
MKNKNDSSPRVDVIIPTYNYGCYLEECLASVLNQTFNDYAVLIIDNASEDNTQQIANKWVKEDSRFTYVRNETNIGLLGSSRKSYALTQARLVLFLSADDLIEPLFLEKTVAALDRHPECSFAYSGWRFFVDNPTQKNHGLENDCFVPHDYSGCYDESKLLLSYNWITNSCCLFRREVCDSVGGPNPADVYHVGDWYIWMRLSAKGPAYYVHESLARYRLHEACETSRLNDAGLSGFGHLYFHDKIFESDLWSWPVRLMAKANQIRWLTGEPLVEVARKMGRGNPNIAQFVDRFRNEFLVEIARCVLHYNALNPNFLDTPQNALTLLQEIVHEDQNNDEAKNLIEKFQLKEFSDIQESSYSTWLATHLWSHERCQRLLACVEQPETLPVIHLLLVVESDRQNLLDSTITDLTVQAFSNWRLTVFSECACPDSRFEASPVLEWVQTLSGQADAITAVVEASPAEWFFCASAGLRLSTLFTLLASLYLHIRPESLLLYTDEDVINAKGEHLQPKLKPDINLELLRSSPYIGAATLIRKPLMLDPRIAILPPGLARNYGAALLAVEQSLTTVDHLDEILVHLPEVLVDEYAATPLANLLVQQHLARCGIIADLCDTPIPGTLFVDYKLPTKPPVVSIIIPVQDRSDLIQSCLDSLLSTTPYPEFEILVIDNSNAEPTVQAFLNALKNRDDRIEVLSYPHQYNLSAIINFAARHAKGEFLLLLGNNTMILQESWLDRLVAIAVRPEVGAVGCRLVSLDQRVQHAGIVLGLDGTTGRIGIEMPLAEPGYMGRAQLTQNFSAVAAACMLVRKDLFLEVGGLDEKDFSILYGDADLCLKLSERGYQIVWTPFVTLAQQSNQDSNVEDDNKKDKNSVSGRKAFIKKWGSRLSNDPAYNRHLSLRQHEWMIDGDFNVPWHPDLEPLPRIVAQPPDEMGVGQYRVIGPIKELTNSGQVCSFLLPPLSSDKRFLPSIPELIRAKPTTLLLQNAFSDFHLDDLQNYAECLPDIFRVFGQDDIVFSVPQKSAARKHFGKDTKARVRRAVSFCHRVIVTNEMMAETLRDMIADIHVVPNYLERFRWGDLEPPRNERRKPRVGWAGAQQHGGDLEFILPVVEATANEVDWIFMGMCPPKLRYHVAEVHNAVPFDQYPAGLAMLDLNLAIAPLELNRFNAAKSNLRLLEYGAVGYPVICTDILPYQNAPVTRVPNNPKAWIDAIREHVHDLDQTRAEGERLREWVLSNWMLDQHLDEWLRALLPG